MQFDDFDKKIKEAAEHHHPAYEEKAWEKMEKLLDKHLPNEKEDKRRIILLLLLLLLTGAGVYLAIAKPWQSKPGLTEKVNTGINQKTPVESSAVSTDKTENNTDKTINTPETGKPAVTDAGTEIASDKIKINKAPKVNPSEGSDVNSADKTLPVAENKNNAEAIIPGKPVVLKHKTQKVVTDQLAIGAIDKSRNKIAGKQKYFNAGNPKKEIVDATENKIADKSQSADDSKSLDAVKTTRQNIHNDNTVKTSVGGLDNTVTSGNTNISTPLISNNPDSALSKKADAVAKIDDEKKNAAPQKKERQKPGKQKKTAFAITITAGPDLSIVGLSEIGKVKVAYGAGLSYSLNRFTLRSGFYVAKKVYSAGPNEYHPPQGSLPYYVNLDKVDADCKLYEIPVTVSYNFSQNKTGNWFASAGLSTYLMKKEAYDYYYKNPVTGTPYKKSWTLENGNKHFFSVVDLSAGYERKFSNTLSVIAEPYIKIPMDGVGFGSIKLNSAGVLFTLSVKPFAAKKVK